MCFLRVAGYSEKLDEFVNAFCTGNNEARYLALVDTPVRLKLVRTQFQNDSQLILQKDSLLSSPFLYKFAKISDQNHSTERFYEPIRNTVISNIIEGQNACVMVAGLSSSGKKRFFFGSEYVSGLIHRVADDMITSSKTGSVALSIFCSDLSGETVMDLLQKEEERESGLVSLVLKTVSDVTNVITEVFIQLREQQQDNEYIFLVRMSIESPSNKSSSVQLMLLNSVLPRSCLDVIQAIEEHGDLSKTIFNEKRQETLALVHCVSGLSENVKETQFVFSRLPALSEELADFKSTTSRPPKNPFVGSTGASQTEKRLGKLYESFKKGQQDSDVGSETQDTRIKSAEFKRIPKNQREDQNPERMQLNEEHGYSESIVGSGLGFGAKRLAGKFYEQRKGPEHQSSLKGSMKVSERLNRLNNKIEEVSSMSKAKKSSQNNRNYQSLPERNNHGTASEKHLANGNQSRHHSRSNSKGSKTSGRMAQTSRNRDSSSSSEDSYERPAYSTKKARRVSQSPLDVLHSGMAKSHEVKRDLVSSYDAIILELKGALKDLVKTCEKQTKQLSEREGMIASLHEQLKETNLELEKSSEAVSALKDGISQKDEEILEIREIVRMELEKKEAKIKKEKENQAKLTDEISARDEEIRIINERIYELSTALTNERHTIEQNKVVSEHLKGQMIEAKESQGKAERKLDILARELEKEKENHLRTAQNLTSLQHKLDKKKTQKKGLADQIKSQFEAELRQVQEEKRRALEELERAQKQVKKEAKAREKIEREHESVKTAFEVLKRGEGTSEKEKSDMGTALKESKKELSALKTAHDQIRREHDELKVNYKRAMEDLARVESKANSENQKKRELKNEKKSHLNEIALLKSQEAKLMDQNERVLLELRNKEKAIEEIGMKLRESESLRAGEIQSLEGRVEQFVENIRGLNEKNGRLEEENSRLSRTIENEKKIASNYREKYKKKKEEAEKHSYELSNVSKPKMTSITPKTSPPLFSASISIRFSTSMFYLGVWLQSMLQPFSPSLLLYRSGPLALFSLSPLLYLLFFLFFHEIIAITSR